MFLKFHIQISSLYFLPVPLSFTSQGFLAIPFLLHESLQFPIWRHLPSISFLSNTFPSISLPPIIPSEHSNILHQCSLYIISHSLVLPHTPRASFLHLGLHINDLLGGVVSVGPHNGSSARLLEPYLVVPVSLLNLSGDLHVLPGCGERGGRLSGVPEMKK